MFRLPRTVFVSFTFAALAACNPYDPDLGNEPFECGSDEPRCPEGYVCDERSDMNHVCVKTQGEDIDAAGTTFQCAPNDIEPNDEPGTAFVTGLNAATPMYKLLGLAVCPTGSDRDHFRFSIATGQNFEATVAGVADRSSLSLAVITTTGSAIATGAPVPGTPQVVRVEIPNRLATGDYVVQVQSPDGTQNNYDLTLKQCSTPLPCP